MIGVAALAGLGVMVYMMRSSASAATASTATLGSSSGSSSGLAGILQGIIDRGVTGYPVETGPVTVDHPLQVSDPVVANKPGVNVVLAPPAADAGGFSVGGGGGGQGNTVAAGLDAYSYGPTYAPGGGMVAFGASNTLTGKALLKNNYGWSEAEYQSWSSNPINAALVPTD